MKNRRNLILLACIVVFFSACGQEAAPLPTETKEEEQLNTPVAEEKAEVQVTPDADPIPEVANEQFDVFDPSEALSEEEVIQLGADGFSGSDKEIAQAILDWQGQHMQLNTEVDQQYDISHPMRWNYFLPGIFPVKDMVNERILENGKIYGICYDYAVIFNAIANYYGLETRVTAHKVYVRESGDIPWPNESEAGTGLLMEEYEALKPKLEKNNLSLSYAQVNRAAKETFGHYRAEVNIDGEWVAFDGAPLRSNAGIVFQVMEWDEGYDADLLYAEVPFSDVDIPTLAELLASAPQPGYEGITDDAGNEHRAANMEDLIAGKGLVPYFQNPEDAANFLQIPEDDKSGLTNISELFEIKGEFEAGTGNPYYVIADMLVYTNDMLDPADFIYLYIAFTGAEMTEDWFLEYIQ
jgi:hypothetical protein